MSVVNKTKKNVELSIFTMAMLFFSFMGKSFAASTLSLNPSSGVIPAEGLYVDVIVENGLDSGIEFTLNYNGNVVVKDAHESFSNSKKYVYNPTVVDVPNAFKVLATNMSGTSSSYTTNGVVTTFLLTPQSKTDGVVTLTLSNLEESSLVASSGAYTYTIGNATAPAAVTSSGSFTSTSSTTPTVTNATDLPQTFLSSKSLLIVGFVLLLVGEFFGQIFNATRSLLRKFRKS